MKALGIDIGGSGVKGAVVDLRTGRLVTERYRLRTPSPATPKAVAEKVSQVVRHFKWKGPVGCAMPGPIKDGRLKAIANLHKSWVGERADAIFAKASGRRVAVLNDADAAGLAEMKFGAGRTQTGVVVLVTLGTGIGSALFANGCLVPNTEFGQLEIGGRTAERRASAKVRKQKDLSWEKWAKRLESYLCQLETLLYPDLIIVGGGISRRSKKFLPLVKTRARILPARLRNEAGIVGAALAAVRPFAR